MMKFSEEQEAYFAEKIAEAERDIALHGTISEKEFWAQVKEMEEEDRMERELKRRNIKLSLIRPFSRITKRFIRA